jgi:ribonuclease HII
MNDLLRLERDLWGTGSKLVAGVDETGRGALAGPLMAAAVILPQGFDTAGIKDSKDMSEAQRAAVYPRLLAEAVAVSVVWVSARVIDEAAEAGRFDDCHKDLLRRAVEALRPEPDFVLIDHYVPELRIENEAMSHAEMVSASIAAAAIVAKITRDRMMADLDRCFPHWGFARNKGYGGGGGEHAAALALHGASAIHRRSSSAVRRALRERASPPESLGALNAPP